MKLPALAFLASYGHRSVESVTEISAFFCTEVEALP